MIRSANRGGRRARTLTLLQEQQLSKEVRRIVPTPWWDDHCRLAIAEGRAALHPGEQGAELAKRGVFPPGPGVIDRSPVHTPMIPCQSRACTTRRSQAEAVHKHYPHYAIAGETTTLADVEVSGIDDAGEVATVRVRARHRRQAYAAARAKGVSPTSLRVVRRGRTLRLCDDCRLALQEAIAARERAAERRAAEAAGQQAETDAQGRPIEPEPELSPSQAVGEAMAIYGIAPIEAKLGPEDEATLRGQIEEYLQLAGGTTKAITISF